MGSRGPAPDPNSRRGRTSFRRIRVEREDQPPLPEIEGFEFLPVTFEWWDRLGRSRLTEGIGPESWNELEICAILHTKSWQGDIGAAAELRQRLAKFGATPADRARLRGSTATAEHLERQRSRTPSDRPAARERFGPLKLV